MVATNPNLPADDFEERHKRRDPNVRIKPEHFVAIRDLSARHSSTQAAYLGRAIDLLVLVEERLAADPVAALEALIGSRQGSRQ